MLGKPAPPKTLITGAGLRQFSFAMPPVAFVGRLRLPQDKPVAVHDLAGIREVVGLDIRGCLGLDFLRNYVLHLDFDQGRLAIAQPSWREAGQPFRLTIDEERVWVEARILEVGPAEPFMVDTGCIGHSGALGAETFYHLAQFGKLSAAGSRGVETTGGTCKLKQARLACLKLGPFEHRDLCFFSHPEHSILGLNFWARYKVTFDFPAGLVYLRQSKRHKLPDLLGGSGLGIRWRNGHLVVVSITAGSPSAKTAIRKGDEVLSIAGRKAGSASLPILGRLLCGEGRTVRIVIRRGEQVREVDLRLDTSWNAAKKERRQTQQARASD
jgi:hypothetical protein